MPSVSLQSARPLHCSVVTKPNGLEMTDCLPSKTDRNSFANASLFTRLMSMGFPRVQDQRQHARLVAEADQHARNVHERDTYVRSIAARVGVAVSGEPTTACSSSAHSNGLM